ncbi:MAG: hypothetical protein K0R97_2894, partial [Oerskovia sp.]|nr:hypothetical protein [Oerskovia sp.]
MKSTDSEAVNDTCDLWVLFSHRRLLP